MYSRTAHFLDQQLNISGKQIKNGYNIMLDKLAIPDALS